MTSTPVVTSLLSDVVATGTTPDANINLFNHFDDPLTTGLVARFELSDPSLGGGVTNVVLYDQPGEGAPISVQNFLNYVEDGDYVDSIIHRSVSGFVVQGGGFVVEGLDDSLADPPSAVTPVPTDPPIQNEFSPDRSNTRGTLAFARVGGVVDSATSQWFFNLADNSANLDNQNGGFTVFGEVVSAADLVPVDAIADLDNQDLSTFFNDGAFTDVPLILENPTDPITGDQNFVSYSSITVDEQPELTFAVVDNTNPDLVNITLTNEQLVLDYLPGQVGTAEVTIQATNLQGVTIEDSFLITVDEDGAIDGPVDEPLDDPDPIDEPDPLDPADPGDDPEPSDAPGDDPVNEDNPAPSDDNNGDGISDSDQPNVASLLQLVNSGSDDDVLTLSAPTGSELTNVVVGVNPAPTDPDNPEAAGITFPVGFLNFDVSEFEDSEVAVRLQLPTGTSDQAFNTFWKFGPTPDNPTDHWYEFLYDGTTGAQFIDTDADGLADEVLLHFVDGERGDSDLTQDGLIIDPGAPGVSGTPFTLTNDSNVVAIDGAGTANLAFTLQTNDSDNISQIGVVRVDDQNLVNGLAPGDPGFVEAALAAGQVLFTTPSNGSDDFLSGMTLTRGLQVDAGDRLLPYLITQSSSNSLSSPAFNPSSGLLSNGSNVFFGLAAANADTLDHLQVTDLEGGGFTLAFEDTFGGGDQDFDDLILTVDVGTAATLSQLAAAPQDRANGELLDLSSPLFAERQVQITLGTVLSDASYNNTFGLYRVEDTEGTVLDPITGAELTPGDAGYANAALQLSQQVGDGITIDRTGAGTTTTFTGGSLYAPFLISNGTVEAGLARNEQVAFAFQAANLGGLDRLQSLGDNTFGFEDKILGGDQDFNDFVVQVEVAVI